MADLSSCLAIVNSLSERDADYLLERVDLYLGAGIAPKDAQRMAANDLVTEIEADSREARDAARAQHPDLFAPPAAAAPAPAAKPRQYFESQPVATREPADALMLSRSNKGASLGAAPMYISRPVANATDLHAWAEAAGITDLVAPEDMHVTIAYSRQPFDAGQLPTAAASVAVAGGKRLVDVLGDEKAVVLRFDSPELQQRWQQTRDAGASWDYEGFKPHVTLSYTAQEVPAGIDPYRGALVLGPEKVEALDTGEAPLLSRAQTETPEFKRWFGASKIVDEDGRPRVMYHGTAQDIEAFVPKQAGAIFLTDEPLFAQAYADTSAKWMESRGKDGASNIVPLYVKAENPFDYEDRQQVAAVRAKLDDAGNWQTMAQLDAGALAEPDNWHLIETDPMQEAIKALGHDGFFVEEGGFKNLAVYAPTQVKSAIGNGGAFDPKNPDLRLSRATGGRFVLPEFGRTARLIMEQQDSENRLKQVVRAVREQGGIVTEASDLYLTEERRINKVSARLQDFQKEVRQFVRDVASEGLTLQEVLLYAYAKHAPERNAHLQERRADGQQSMSGMSTADALAIQQEATEAGLAPALERLHATLMRWTKGTLAINRDEGLISNELHASLDGMFDYYVPLRGHEDEDSGQTQRTSRGQGGRRSVLGPRMMGRHSEAGQVLENIIHARVMALIKAGENEVRRSFLQFVLDNPDPALWEVDAVESKPVLTVDDAGEQVIEERERAVTDDKRTVVVWDGGKAVSVWVKDPVMREQLNRLGVEKLGPYLGLMRAANRNLGRLYTGLNLAFAVKNFVRDIGTAGPSMIDAVGFFGAAKMYANLPRAVWHSFLAETGHPPEEFQLWRAAGGKTGFMGLVGVDDIAKDLERTFADAQRVWVNPRVWLPKVLDLIESVSAVLENATRYAGFLAARSEGKSLLESVSVGQNLTVNFTRRGTKTAQMSAWFMFYNPAVQGTTRVLQALKSPKVLATLGAGMTGVALLALRNASMGDDDDGVPWWDKIPQDVKDRNLIVMLPPGATAGEAVPGSKQGRYIKVPLPYGWNWFGTVTNQAVDMLRHAQDPARGVTPTQAMKNVVTSFLNAFSPVPDVARSVDSPKSLALLALPDFLDPIAQAGMNVNAFGRPLHPESPNQRNLPDSEKAFTGQVGTAYHRAARALNAATGGTQYTSGLLDLSPGSIENLVRAYGGGPATFSLDILNTMYARQSIKRPDVEWRRAPVLRDFYAQIDDESDRVLAYSRMDMVRAVVEPLHKAMSNGGEKEALAIFNKDPAMASLADTLALTQRLLSQVRKEELEIVNGTEADDAKYAKLLVTSAKRRTILQQLNKAFDKAVRDEAAAKAGWEVEAK